MQERNNKILIVIFLISFCIGIFFIIFNPMPYGDQSDYDIHARNLLNGNGISLATQPPYFPDVYRVPGMGIFLYLIYSVFGVNYTAVKIIQAALNALVPIFIYYLCKRTFNDTFAYIAAFAVALYPFTTLFVPVISSETLCIFLFCLGLFLFEKGRESNKKIFFFLAGITYGYCLLVRPGTALMPLFLTIGYLLVSDFKKIWRFLLVFNISVFIIWAPWIIRNHTITNKFIPLTVEGNEMFYWATGSIGKYFDNRMYNPKFKQQLANIDEELKASKLEGMERVIKEEELYLKFSIQNIKDEPVKYIISTIARIPRMWVSIVNNDEGRGYGYKVHGGTQNIFNMVKYFMIFNLILGVYGIWVWRHNWRETIFLAIPIFYFSLTHMLILTEARFTLPGRPFLIIFTLIGLIDIVGKICRRFDIKFDLLDVKIIKNV